MRMGEEVFDHDIEHGMHTIIGHGVKHLFAAPVGFEDPGRAQEPQMVAGQRGGNAQMIGNIASRAFVLLARNHNRQARGIGQQAERIGQFAGLIGGEFGVAHDKQLNDCSSVVKFVFYAHAWPRGPLAHGPSPNVRANVGRWGRFA